LAEPGGARRIGDAHGEPRAEPRRDNSLERRRRFLRELSRSHVRRIVVADAHERSVRRD